MTETINIHKLWTIRKFESDEHYRAFLRGEAKPFEVSSFEGNVLLNSGITELIDLLLGTGTPTNYGNTNAQLGVGTDATAESAAQTGLLGTAVFQDMEATYPQVSGQTITWRAVFGESDANQTWQEFTVRNGSTADVPLNRKVSDQGTKASGQTWTLDLSITFS